MKLITTKHDLSTGSYSTVTAKLSNTITKLSRSVYFEQDIEAEHFIVAEELAHSMGYKIVVDNDPVPVDSGYVYLAVPK